MRPLSLALLLLPVGAFAQVNECEETFLECSDDCSLEHSSIRAEAAKKLEKCLKKCRKKRVTCEERELETKSNNLDQGALDKSPTSRDVDENGMPTRTAVKKPKSTDDEEKPARSDELRDDRRPSPGDDLRDDRPAPEPAPKRSKPPKETTEARAPKDELRDTEVPRSSRTELKVDEREAKKSEPKEARAEPKAEPIVMTPKAEARRSAEDDLRDDRPAPKQEPPPRKSEKKRDDLPPPPPKPKEEDHDDLRNY